MQELSSRVSEKVCGEIIAMSRDLDRLDPRWLGRVLSRRLADSANSNSSSPKSFRASA